MPYSEKIGDAVRAFSLTEKIVFGIFAGLLATSAFVLLSRANDLITTAVPAQGGSLSEGVIGLPRFANPLLALSDTDRDLTALIYSGLLKQNSAGGYAPDLAESYSVSDDGLSYTFKLRANDTFQDGTPLTADDVIFTVQRAQDANLKSPKRANWDGVKVEKIDTQTVKFTLKQPYAPFIGNLTLGILPKHIWNNVSADQFPFSLENTEPIGSGPYQIQKITRDSSGLPILYQLAAFPGYALGEPHISNIAIHFYASQDALESAEKSGAVESIASVAPEDVANLLSAGHHIERAPSSRIFGVFFNQNQAAVFTHKEVRQVLDMATDRNEIIKTALGGYATALGGPVPPETLGSANSSPEFTASTIAAAKSILLKKGWTANAATGFLELTTKDAKTKKTTTVPLAFTLSTSNAPELVSAANTLKAQWAKIGANVTIKTYEPGDLTQEAIRPREYDALLFGEIVGQDLDLYAFWHSSQRLDPGLNIALYANTAADKDLEKMRSESDPAAQAKEYADFAGQLQNDVPAVFLYSPDFLYLVPDKIQGIALGQISAGSERFAGVSSWYIETDRIWNFLLSGMARLKAYLKT